MEMDPIIGRDVLQELQELPGPPSESKRPRKGYAVRLVTSSALLCCQGLRYAADVPHMDYFHYYYQKIIDGSSNPHLRNHRNPGGGSANQEAARYIIAAVDRGYEIGKGGHSGPFPFFGLASSRIS